MPKRDDERHRTSQHCVRRKFVTYLDVPETKLVFFKEDDGTVPALAWLISLPEDARDKGWRALRQLALHGYDLRRPLQDTLRNGVHELRWRLGHVNYRILFTIEQRTIALLEAGLTKEDVVPSKEIDRAATRAAKWRTSPSRYSYEKEKDDE